jgi:hypothetical protein
MDQRFNFGLLLAWGKALLAGGGCTLCRPWGLEGSGGRDGEDDERDGWYDAGGYLAERFGASAGMGGNVFDLE